MTHRKLLRWSVAMGATMIGIVANAQNIGINVNGAAPNVSALLDIDASALPVNGKLGLLIPRMATAERTAIATPATGLLVYDTSLNAFWYFNGTVWTPIGVQVEVDPTWDGAADFTGATWRSGNVGIGTTAAPNSKLQVVGRVFIDNSANVHALAGNPALTADGALGEDILRIRDVGANNRLLVNSAGHVGISTSTPTARLSIATIGSQLELGGTAASLVFRSNFGGLGTTASTTAKLASIGFTSLAENISLGFTALRTANGNNSSTTAIGLLYDVDATSPVNGAEIWLTHAGNVGIGTNAPTAKLDVNGKIRGTAIYSSGSSSMTSTTVSTALVNNNDIATTINVQNNDIIKVDCACNLSNSLTGTTLMNVNNTAGLGIWIQMPNFIMSSGPGWSGGHSTGIIRATADGAITFTARWRVTSATGSAQNCNITAVVIGKQ